MIERKTRVILCTCILLVWGGEGRSQEYPVMEFEHKSEALRRFYSTRGAERLPSVRLDLAPTTLEEAYVSALGQAPIVVHGGIAFSQEVTDNLFLGNAGRLGSVPGGVLNTISPSVRLEIPSKTLPIFINYGVDIIRAGNYERLFNTEEHHIGGTVQLKLGDLKLTANNSLERLSIPPRDRDQLLINYWDNVTDVEAEIRFGPRLRTESFYSHEIVKFDRIIYKSSDFDLDRLGQRVYYRLFPRTWVVVEYEHDFIDDYWDTGDAEVDRVGGGLEWDITSRLSGVLKAGREWYDHARSPTVAGGVYWHGELSYAYTRNLVFSLYTDRSVSLTSRVTGDNIYGGTFTSTQYALRGLYRISPQLSFDTDLFWLDDKSPPGFFNPRRHSYTKGFSVGLDWEPVRYLRFGTMYRYQRVDSTVDSEEFVENMFMFNASLGF